MPKFISKWVPILDEHVLRDEDGNPLVKIDEKRLQYIASRNNRRVESTGDYAPIVIGHTKDDAPEDQQPKTVGWMTRYRVAPWKNGKKAIYALSKFYKHLRGEINQYPRRSVELWLSDWKIDPLSLLGATTPERDLGLLRLSKGGSKLRRELPIMDPKELVHAVMAALKESAVFKWAEKKMKEEEAANQDGLDQQEPGLEDDLENDMEGDDLEGDGLDDLGGDAALEGAEEGLDDEDDDLGEEPVRMSAGASVASGTNTAVPNGLRDRQRMARDQKRGKLARLQRQQKATLRQVNELKVQYQRAIRERDLIQLESEGYDFDRVDELDTVAPMDDPSYQKHLVRIRKRYRKAPVGFGQDYSNIGRSVVGTSGAMSKDRMSQIVSLASAKGISYEAARQELGETE